MKHFYLIINSEKQRSKEVAAYISDYLKSHGAVCVCQDRAARGSGQGYRYTDARGVPEATQCVITLGGDGTLIQAARDLADCGLPLVGVNLGHLGYLTQIGREEELAPMLDALLRDNYRLEKRMMIQGIVFQGGQAAHEDIALNDIVITRQDALKVLKFRIYVNEDFLNEYTADGVILSTPTGSTAYNLSAGGPIAAPNAEVIILTPICPHTLNSRSIVLSASDRIQIKIVGEDTTVRTAVFDGDTLTTMAAEDWIEIRKSGIYTTLVKLKDISFLDNLRNKMSGI